MSRQRADAGARLARALRNSLVPFAGTCRVETLESQDWRSVTFAGARHRLQLQLEGADAGKTADALLARVETADFELPGHILADIRAVAQQRDLDGRMVGIRLDALTVEAG